MTLYNNTDRSLLGTIPNGGNLTSATFGHIVKAASPRLVQLGVKVFF